MQGAANTRAEERKLAKIMDALKLPGVSYKEDRKGQHAIQIDIPLNGTYRHHVLIYDKDNKRTKVIVYELGHYAC